MRRRTRRAAGRHLGHTGVVETLVEPAPVPSRAPGPSRVPVPSRAPVPPPGRAPERAGTRERVLSLLLELGPATTAVLSGRLGLSPAAVRRHLDALLAEGTVSSREPRVRAALRGRPARQWALTEAGHAAGPTAYDDLAVTALRFLADAGGRPAVKAFADTRARQLEQRYRDRVVALPGPQRVEALAAALSEDGYAAGAAAQGSGVQLCQHHCPVQHVAQEFPQLCEAETAAFGRLLGVHVQRLATIAHGDGVCTTYVPHSSTPTGKARA